MKHFVKLTVVGGVIGMSETSIKTKKYSVLPFGPQHPVLPEPVHLKFLVDEEKIVDVLPN